MEGATRGVRGATGARGARGTRGLRGPGLARGAREVGERVGGVVRSSNNNSSNTRRASSPLGVTMRREWAERDAQSPSSSRYESHGEDDEDIEDNDGGEEGGAPASDMSGVFGASGASTSHPIATPSSAAGLSTAKAFVTEIRELGKAERKAEREAERLLSRHWGDGGDGSGGVGGEGEGSGGGGEAGGVGASRSFDGLSAQVSRLFDVIAEVSRCLPASKEGGEMGGVSPLSVGMGGDTGTTAACEVGGGGGGGGDGSNRGGVGSGGGGLEREDRIVANAYDVIHAMQFNVFLRAALQVRRPRYVMFSVPLLPSALACV